MKLSEYLEVNGISAARLAKSLDIPEATFSTYVNERNEPKASNALKIINGTHGAVSLQDLCVEEE